MAYLVVLLSLAVAGAAFAQTGGKGGRRGEAKGAPRESIDLFQAMADELRIDLKLDEKQAKLWDAYMGRIDALKRDMARQNARAREASADAPRALDRLVDVQRDRLAAMEDIADAGRALYKTLDEQQRSVADGRLARLVTAATAAPEARPPLPR